MNRQGRYKVKMLAIYKYACIYAFVYIYVYVYYNVNSFMKKLLIEKEINNNIIAKKLYESLTI